MARSIGAARRRRGTAENSKERELRLQVAQLKRLVADKTLEADFFKSALQKDLLQTARAGRASAYVSGGNYAMPKIMWMNLRCAMGSPLATQRT